MDFRNMWNRLKRLISRTFQDLSDLCEMRYAIAARNFENASQAYLFRDRSNQTLMNLERLSPFVRVHLRHVYLTSYCILGFFAFGVLAAWWLLPLGNMGGLSTRLLFFTSFTLFISRQPWDENKRLCFLVNTAFFGGAYIGHWTDLLLMIDPGFIVSAAVALSMPLGCLVVASLVTRQRDYMYIGGLLSCLLLIPIWLHFASIIFGGYTAIYKFKLCFVILPYVGLIVVSSQQIIRRVQRGEFDYDYVQDALLLLVDFAYICTILSVFYLLWKEASEEEREKQLNSTSSSSDWIEAVLLDPNV